MKHIYGEWEEDPETGDSYTICRRCKVIARIKNKQTTKNFKQNGKWTPKVPPCEQGTP
jgi:hypothetical protein